MPLASIFICERGNLFPSFQRDRQLSANRNVYQSPRMLAFVGLLLYISVHWNARMTEMKQSGIEVLIEFADNVGKLPKR